MVNKKLLTQWALLICVQFFLGQVHANITAVAVTPTQKNLSLTANTNIALSWTVATGGSTDRISSGNAQLINQKTGAVLSSLGGVLFSSGVGPLQMNESLSISNSQVTTWVNQGVSKILLRREFVGVINNKSADVVLNLPTSNINGITAVAVTPTQKNLSLTANNNIALRWTVATGGSTDRISSANAQLINQKTGAVLSSLGGALSSSGVGPLQMNESLSISKSQVTTWVNQGVSKILLRREFVGVINNKSADVVLNLPSSNIKGARVAPTQAQVFAGRENAVQSTWLISTGKNHTTGLQSTGLTVVHPQSGKILSRIPSRIVKSGGGPFQIAESITLNRAEVQSWLDQGVDRVLLQRRFTNSAGGDATDASIIVVINDNNLSSVRSASAGALLIKSLRIEFDTGNDKKLLNQNTATKAKVTIAHSGSGVLEGRWQIAEPGSTDGQPLYRTLALVKKNLVANQRSFISSPELPTLSPGKYQLRFCVSNREMQLLNNPIDLQCPIENLVVNATYQVQGLLVANPKVIVGLSPNQQTINENTSFSWLSVEGAQIYQLQIFSLSSSGDLVSAPAGEKETMKPHFIVGMVLPAKSTSTKLSDLVRSKLMNNHRYLWKVTAHDAAGRLVAASNDPSFIYKDTVEE